MSAYAVENRLRRWFTGAEHIKTAEQLFGVEPRSEADAFIRLTYIYINCHMGSISCMAVFFCISEKNHDNFRLIILKF